MAGDIKANPVIGVILMIAITVILATVIAAFVFGMGAELGELPSDTTPPQEEIEGSIEDFRIYNDARIVINGEIVFTGDVHIMSTTSDDHMIFVKGD